MQVLDSVGLDHVGLGMLAVSLPLAESPLIEIARGMARGARVPLLVEPTATLSAGEIDKVFAVLRHRKAVQVTTMVIISHRLNEIVSLTDRVTVLRSGQHVMTEQTADLTSGALALAMIGQEIQGREGPLSHARRDTAPRLALTRWTLPGRFAAVTLTVQPGEIVSLVVQLGSGADSLLESLAGLQPGTGG